MPRQFNWDRPCRASAPIGTKLVFSVAGFATGSRLAATVMLLPDVVQTAGTVLRQLKIRLAFTPCRRATSATDAPAQKASATIRCFSVDAAFVRTPVGNVEGLLVDRVLEEPMVVALPAGHDLVRIGASSLTLAALGAEPFILYRRPAGPGLYDAIVTAYRGAAFSPVIEQEAPRLPSTLSLVAAGLGITIVPASMEQVAMPGVAFRALHDCPGLSAPINLALRRPPSATAARFRETVRQLAS